MFMPPVPPPGKTSAIGFNTIAMWGLCLVVVGVCYKLEQNDVVNKGTRTTPDDVAKVLPSGAWLMSTFRAATPVPACPTECCWCAGCALAEDGSIQKR